MRAFVEFFHRLFRQDSVRVVVPLDDQNERLKQETRQVLTDAEYRISEVHRQRYARLKYLEDRARMPRHEAE